MWRGTRTVYIYGDVILASFLYKPIIFENKVAWFWKVRRVSLTTWRSRTFYILGERLKSQPEIHLLGCREGEEEVDKDKQLSGAMEMAFHLCQVRWKRSQSFYTGNWIWFLQAPFVFLEYYWVKGFGDNRQREGFSVKDRRWFWRYKKPSQKHSCSLSSPLLKNYEGFHGIPNFKIVNNTDKLFIDTFYYPFN